MIPKGICTSTKSLADFFLFCGTNTVNLTGIRNWNRFRDLFVRQILAWTGYSWQFEQLGKEWTHDRALYSLAKGWASRGECSLPMSQQDGEAVYNCATPPPCPLTLHDFRSSITSFRPSITIFFTVLPLRIASGNHCNSYSNSILMQWKFPMTICKWLLQSLWIVTSCSLQTHRQTDKCASQSYRNYFASKYHQSLQIIEIVPSRCMQLQPK